MSELAVPIPEGLTGLAKLAADKGWLKWAIVITASFAAILEVVASDLSAVNAITGG